MDCKQLNGLHRLTVFLLPFLGINIGLVHAHAHCFTHAAQTYRVPETLIRTISRHESGGQVRAINRNKDGSYDMGLMQINSRWLTQLQRLGLQENDLWDPCVNVLVGAWILRNNFNRYNDPIQAIGAYNSSIPEVRERYARKILADMEKNYPSPAR